LPLALGADTLISHAQWQTLVPFRGRTDRRVQTVPAGLRRSPRRPDLDLRRPHYVASLRRHLPERALRRTAAGDVKFKILVASDLHYRLKQFDWLIAQTEQFDALAIVEDILDVSAGLDLNVQIVVIKKYLNRISEKASLLICSGNHDGNRKNDADEYIAPWLQDLRGRQLRLPPTGPAVGRLLVAPAVRMLDSDRLAWPWQAKRQTRQRSPDSPSEPLLGDRRRCPDLIDQPTQLGNT
jgi:hypothetical protein